MYMASLSIIILTLFGFWFSALGFGVYGLYVFNHNQVSDATVEPLNNKFERFAGQKLIHSFMISFIN